MFLTDFNCTYQPPTKNVLRLYTVSLCQYWAMHSIGNSTCLRGAIQDHYGPLVIFSLNSWILRNQTLHISIYCCCYVSDAYLFSTRLNLQNVKGGSTCDPINPIQPNYELGNRSGSVGTVYLGQHKSGLLLEYFGHVQNIRVAIV